MVERIGEGFGEHVGEDVGEGRWLTYTELAEIRGIGRESTVKLAQRERWRKLSGNSPDRTVRVFVPAEWLKPAKGERIGEAFPEDSGELSRLVSGLQDTVAFVRERAEAAEARADAAETARRSAEARADAERVRADRAEDDRRTAEGRADEARQHAERAVARADQERLAADRFRAEVEAARAEAQQAQATVREAHGAAATARLEAAELPPCR